MELWIYGAKSIALGVCRALQELYPEHPVKGFLVSSHKGNPFFLAGLPVREIGNFSRGMTQAEKDKICILIGTPEDMHLEITGIIQENGFRSYVCMDSKREAALMERYFSRQGIFPALHSLPQGNESPQIQVFMIKFYKDHLLEHVQKLREWVHPIQVGADLTDIRIAELTDNTGDNISAKNGNYCEMTAFYWLWKNRLLDAGDHMEYYGFFHYRRILDISMEDLRKLKANDIDAVLQFPTLHEPDIGEHHNRYLKTTDWDAMLYALKELEPEYAKAYHDIFSQQYFYNYNMIIAKKRVLADYCAWLFPILKRTEELSTPKGWQRSDRYTAYMSESLMTLYFLYHQKDLKIFHAGRLMFT